MGRTSTFVQQLRSAHVELLKGFGCNVSVFQRFFIQVCDCSWGYRILVGVGVESFQKRQYGLFVVLVQFRVVFWLRWSDTHIDFLPCLKAGDSYSGQLNEALRFGGFPLRWRPRCDRLAPVSVLRRLHGRLTTPRVPRRRGYSVRRSNHGRAVCRIAGIPIRVRPTVSCHPCVRIGSRFGCWDTSGRCV